MTAQISKMPSLATAREISPINYISFFRKYYVFVVFERGLTVNVTPDVFDTRRCTICLSSRTFPGVRDDDDDFSFWLLVFAGFREAKYQVV